LGADDAFRYAPSSPAPYVSCNTEACSTEKKHRMRNRICCQHSGQNLFKYESDARRYCYGVKKLKTDAPHWSYNGR
jgi:hypothetical protein